VSNACGRLYIISSTREVPQLHRREGQVNMFEPQTTTPCRTSNAIAAADQVHVDLAVEHFHEKSGVTLQGINSKYRSRRSRMMKKWNKKAAAPYSVETLVKHHEALLLIKSGQLEEKAAYIHSRSKGLFPFQNSADRRTPHPSY
jgi:hypothetical protein